jgi:type I restriction enzyme S subunit
MWKDVKLDDLFHIGSSKRVLKSQWQTEGVPFYRGREVTRLSKYGYVDNELFISQELYKEYSEKHGVPTSGDIVITAIGTIGNSYIVRDQDRFYFKDASVLWLKKTSDVSSEFINYWLKSSLMKEQLDEDNGATVDTLTIRKLESLRVKLPPLSEQKRIVAILDEAFAGIETAIANTEKNLANARELFESYLNAVFSRVPAEQSETLFNLCSPKTITYGVIKLGQHQENGVPCLRTSNVRRLNIETDEIKKIDPALSRQYGRTVLEGGEVLISVRGTLGGVAVADESMKGWNVSREVAVAPVDAQRVSPTFIAYSIATRASQDWLTGVQKGIAYTGINLADLRELRVSLPMLDEQKDIVGQLDDMAAACRSLEALYRGKLAALAEFKQSLLQKAFSGELTAEAVDEPREAVA